MVSPNETTGLKLFVVGSSSPDPEKWDCWDEVALVIASNAEEAAKLACRSGYSVAEVSFEKAKVLVVMPEPNIGEDI